MEKQWIDVDYADYANQNKEQLHAQSIPSNSMLKLNYK